MDAKDLMIEALGRIRSVLQRSLADLSLDDIHRQPQAGANSIAWLAWHLTRVQDVAISGLVGREQAWVSQGWHARFAMAPDPDNDGYGDTPEQVALLRVSSAQLLLDYHDDVQARSLAYVQGLLPADFDRTLDEPQWQPLPTVGVRLVSVLSDNLQHAGQAVYLRGLWQHEGELM